MTEFHTNEKKKSRCQTETPSDPFQKMQNNFDVIKFLHYFICIKLMRFCKREPKKFSN